METKRNEFRDDWTIPDLTASYELLASQPSVDAERIGVVGHCWGGRVSWVGAVSNPRLKACAIFYGGRVRQAMGPNPPAIDRTADIRCPVIGFFGNLDQSPSPEDVNVYAEALGKAGVEHIFHRYDGANHAVQNNYQPDRYHAEASEDAWKKVLAFFDAKLKT